MEGGLYTEQYLWHKRQVVNNFAVLNIFFMGYLYRPLSIKTIKYQCWYLTPYCGLEVEKPTQALKSVKGRGQYLWFKPKWSRTMPSLIYFSWDINTDPPPKYIKDAKFLPTWGVNQRYFWAFNRLKCLDGFPHLKPTAGCQISALIFDFFLWRGICINIPWKIYWILIQTPLYKNKSNIKADSWHLAVGLRCGNPPRHFSQLKAQKYLWLTPQVDKKFAVLNILFMGY
jgi:hypothetical protein